MTTFTLKEILLSVEYAAIFGVSFAICECALFAVKSSFCGTVAFFSSIFRYNKLLFIEPLERRGKKRSALWIFISIMCYSLSFILLSYYTLDGCIRGYMLLISLSCVYVFKKYVLPFVSRLISPPFIFFECTIIVVLRMLLLPLRIIFGWVLYKFPFMSKKSV